MNKAEIIRHLAGETELTRAAATRAVDALFSPEGIIAGALNHGESVQIPGFGRFEKRQRIARRGRNPRTGAEIEIAARSAVVFRGSKALKDILAVANPDGPRGPRPGKFPGKLSMEHGRGPRPGVPTR